MNISFLRNAQAEEKEEMSYFCMHAPAADGHAAAQMPAGAGRGVPAGAAPGPPRQLQHPQPWGGSHTTLPPSQDETPPAKHLTQEHISWVTHGAVGPGDFWHHPPRSESRIPAPGGGWGGLAPNHTFPNPRLPCAAGSRRGSGAARLHRRFFPHKLRPRRKPAPGKN